MHICLHSLFLFSHLSAFVSIRSVVAARVSDRSARAIVSGVIRHRNDKNDEGSEEITHVIMCSVVCY